MYWGDQNDADYLGYYNSKFMGFAQTTVYQPDNAVQVHQYYAGEGWGVYDTSKVTCYTTAPCHNDPWWDLANAAHGQEYQMTQYDTDGATVLQQTNTTYKATCPPAGVSGTPDYGSYSFDGQLISELSKNNPVAACAIQQTQQVMKTFDGTSSPVTMTNAWTYDSYGRATQETTTANGGTPGTIVHNTSYVWNDGVTATQNSAIDTCIIDTSTFTDTEDGSGNRLECSTTSYDGQGYATGQSSNLTGGQATSATSYANCGTAANSYTTSGPRTTTTAYDTYSEQFQSRCDALLIAVGPLSLFIFLLAPLLLGSPGIIGSIATIFLLTNLAGTVCDFYFICYLLRRLRGTVLYVEDYRTLLVFEPIPVSV